MEQQLTPWFVNGEMPARPGVYNVSCQKHDQSGRWFSRWDGDRWFLAGITRADAAWQKTPATRLDTWHNYGSWRGLTQDPSAKT